MMKPCERLVVRLAGLVPVRLLQEPERALLSVACIVLGVAAYLPPPGGLVDSWPDWWANTWASLMAVGGLAALYGTFSGDVPAARAGAVAIAVPALIYGVWLPFYMGWPGVISSVIFCCLGLGKLVRLLLTSAAAAAVLSRLRDLDNRPAPPLEEAGP